MYPKGNQSWIFIGRTDAEAWNCHLMWRTDSLKKTLMLGKTKAAEWDHRGWNGWMGPLNQWTWFWASSGSWWWTGNPGGLQSMRLQRAGHNWATELNYLVVNICQTQPPPLCLLSMRMTSVLICLDKCVFHCRNLKRPGQVGWLFTLSSQMFKKYGEINR